MGNKKATLMTNMKHALDPAFVRRLRFIVRSVLPHLRLRKLDRPIHEGEFSEKKPAPPATETLSNVRPAVRDLKGQ